jgi:hypothetical protein
MNRQQRGNGQPRQSQAPPPEHRAQSPPNRGDAYEEPEQSADGQPRRPVTEYRLGRVKAVVWQNETQLGARHSVQFFRLYKPEGSEHWQSATSFNRDDLPLVAKLADLAMMFIYGSMQTDGI